MARDQTEIMELSTGSTIAIRAYREQDWRAVCDIWNRAKPDELRGVCDPDQIVPLQDDDFMVDLFRTSHVIVGEIDGRIVGFAGRKGKLISWLFVDPDHYRNGYGSLLLAEILALIGPGAFLHVAAGNRPAIALYRKFGFEISRRYESKYHDCPVDVMIMRKEVGR